MADVVVVFDVVPYGVAAWWWSGVGVSADVVVDWCLALWATWWLTVSDRVVDGG